MRISSWIRRTLQAVEPDAVLSFLTQTNILTIVATRGLGVRTVISERNDPRLQRHRPRVELLRRVVYPWADIVTANSKGALATLGDFVPKEKLAFLPNPMLPVPATKGGAFVAPTVIGGVDNAWRIAQEEVFGPVVTLTRFGDEAEAVRLANDVRFGLAATVWTGDSARYGSP